MIIRHNIPGLNATRNKGISQGKMIKNLEKLSSGYRINRAGDDAAGLALSEGMRNQIRGLDQALKNCNDGVGLTQTGEGALTEVHSMLQRMKTLAIQSANGTYSTIARESLDAERIRLLDEIDRIGETSNFNDIPLFDSEEIPQGAPIPVVSQDNEVVLQVGCSAQEILDMDRYHMGSQQLHLDDTDFATQDGANKSVKLIDDAIEAVSDIRAEFGAAQNRLGHAFNNLSVMNENMNAAESQIRDTNYAEEFTDYTKNNIVLQSSNAMAAQANTTVQNVLSLLQ